MQRERSHVLSTELLVFLAWAWGVGNNVFHLFALSSKTQKNRRIQRWGASIPLAERRIDIFIALHVLLMSDNPAKRFRGSGREGPQHSSNYGPGSGGGGGGWGGGGRGGGRGGGGGRGRGGGRGSAGPARYQPSMSVDPWQPLQAQLVQQGAISQQEAGVNYSHINHNHNHNQQNQQWNNANTYAVAAPLPPGM